MTVASADRTGSRIRDRGTDAALIALVALGAVARLWSLGSQRLNYDESFTAIAGRLPVGRLFSFLTAHDSHPPLDYLLRAPLARAGVSDFWFRFPSAVCSIAALALLAVWLRPRGRVAVVATALFALSAFEIAHGRDARMYAELELLGVGIAVLADAWLRRPSPRRALLLGALVLAGLSLHVSMFLLAVGLLVLAGRRRDRDAWRWRCAILGAIGIWAVTWGPHFLVQARGGHSAWIPTTSAGTLIDAIARSVTFDASVAALVVAAVLAGGVLLGRRDRRLGRVFVACFVVPIAIGAVAGLAEPVVLDRTFTLMAWAPAVAIAFAVDAAWRQWRVVGFAGVVALAAVALPGARAAVSARSGPTVPLAALGARIRTGDVVAVRPASKAPELQWSLGVHGGRRDRAVEVAGLRRTFALRIGDAPSTGRVWFLDWHGHRSSAASDVPPDACARTWKWGTTRISCLSGLRVERPDRHVRPT